MRTGNILSDMFYTAVVWTPIVAVVIGISIVMYGGVAQLEATTSGSSTILANEDSQGRLLHLQEQQADAALLR